MKTLFFILVMALVLLPSTARTDAFTSPAITSPLDPRPAQLTRFFRQHHCPQINYDLIPDYIRAADANNIPYTLLPSISLQESSCIQHYRLNNPFGWNSARSGFSSIAEGIRFVSKQLAEGKYYAGKTIDNKLRAYNPNPAYAPRIEQLMKEISNE